MAEAREVVRLAAVGDIHCHRKSRGVLRPFFAQMSQSADIVLLCGDLTDYGLPEEAHVLADEITSSVNVPVVAVLGNHDFESGKQEQVHDILCEANVTVLDGDSCEVRGVGIAGVKGFAGGFGRYALEAWGESIIKQFVHEAVNEAVKLEAALARLDSSAPKVGLLHYSPILETVQGEPVEIIPFLGCRRLEEPLTRFPVDVIFHGHAHHGSAEGRTVNGIPVYNVAMPVMKKAQPGKAPFRIFEVTVGAAEETIDGASAEALSLPSHYAETTPFASSSS